MKTFIFITIVITLFVIPSVVPLTFGENTALNDMNNIWGDIMGWKGSPNCNWKGISCNWNGNVIEMFVKII